MTKEIYEKPILEVVELNIEATILTASVLSSAEDINETEGSWGA